MKTIATLAPLTALLAVFSLCSCAPIAQTGGVQAGNSTTSLLNADSSAAASDAAGEHKTMQAQCFERSQLLFDLAKDQGEHLSQTKRFGENGLLEAFTSPTEGTWTIVYSDSDKRSCIIASGGGLPVVEDDSAEDARVPKRVEARI